MGIGKLFKGDPKIATLAADRAAELTKRREELADRRQHLVWKHQKELDSFDGGPGKELADFEAACRAWEAKQEETIATESLEALRKAARDFGDSPRTATIGIRDAWRSHVRRVHDELGPEREPNFLLLAATFLDDDSRDVLGSQAFLESRIIAGDLAASFSALSRDSVPRMTYALQNLHIGVDELARSPDTQPDEAASRAIETSATHATVASRVTIGDALAGMIAAALHMLETQQDVAASPPPEVIVQAPAAAHVPEAFVAPMVDEPPMHGDVGDTFVGE